MNKTRAAVVLFVDIDENEVSDSSDLYILVQQGLRQQLKLGSQLSPNILLPVQFGKRALEVRIVGVMDAGQALGNGYLWAQPTATAWRNRGIYTEKEQAQIDAEEHREEMGQ
jgi:hypothetical protein